MSGEMFEGTGMAMNIAKAMPAATVADMGQRYRTYKL